MFPHVTTGSASRTIHNLASQQLVTKLNLSSDASPSWVSNGAYALAAHQHRLSSCTCRKVDASFVRLTLTLAPEASPYSYLSCIICAFPNLLGCG